jgi:hypothetical protein
MPITARLFSLEVKAEDWMVNLPLCGIHELAGVG